MPSTTRLRFNIECFTSLLRDSVIIVRMGINFDGLMIILNNKNSENDRPGCLSDIKTLNLCKRLKILVGLAAIKC